MDMDDHSEMELGSSVTFTEDSSSMDNNFCHELTKRLEESENSYKVFGFSHVIITGSVTDIMDTTFRTTLDGMYRRTKSHCKTDHEAELYRQRLCKLYLAYVKKGLAIVDGLEPKLVNILKVKEETPSVKINDQIAALRTKVAERTIRIKSLLALQNRLKTDTVLAEWVISEVEPIVHEAEKDLGNMECISPNDVLSFMNSLNRLKTSLSSLEIK